MTSDAIRIEVVTANGLYYLGISNGGAVANSSGGPIWNTGNAGPFVGERAPDGTGAGSPFTGWSSYGVNNLTFNYAINLQGADFAVAPEPSSFLLAAPALVALAARRAGKLKGATSHRDAPGKTKCHQDLVCIPSGLKT